MQTSIHKLMLNLFEKWINIVFKLLKASLTLILILFSLFQFRAKSNLGDNDIKGGFESEDTGKFLLLQNEYSKSLSWAENLNELSLF